MSQVRVARAHLTRVARRAAAMCEMPDHMLRLLDDAKTDVSREVSEQLRHENECPSRVRP